MPINWKSYLGQTCEAALLLDSIRLCKEEARFSYRGIKPPLKIEFAWQTIRTTLILCEDHAKKIITDFSWQIKAGEVEVLRLDLERLTVSCNTCFSVIRLEIVGNNLVQLPDAYCVRCGTRGSLKHDPERDWEDLFAERYDGMDRRLLHLLYNNWENMRQWPRFKDYVDHEIAEIMKGA